MLARAKGSVKEEEMRGGRDGEGKKKGVIEIGVLKISRQGERKVHRGDERRLRIYGKKI